MYAGLALRRPVIEMDNFGLLARLGQPTDSILIGSARQLERLTPDLGLVAVPTAEIKELRWGLSGPGKPRCPGPHGKS